MATVFLAHDPDMHREVAIKLLPREFLNDPTFRARFRREARVIASLDHPAILPVYDFGEDDGLLFFVMPLMSGGSLADRLKNGALSIAETIKLLARIGPALDYAHQKGIIHRDLKPANILFDRFDNAFLADFGIAHLEQSGATLTGGNIIGTPAYMSPEQARATNELDGRTDIYALGGHVV
ncbi:MAG: serine/threonine protein kinase [Chloroflexi bacterium]|nr:serine/threonine protein kinase [Chloroflexota bacterium]